MSEREKRSGKSLNYVGTAALLSEVDKTELGIKICLISMQKSKPKIKKNTI